MALDFQFPASQPLQGGLSIPIPISIGTVRVGNPATVVCNIDWTEYGASSTRPVTVAVDLLQGGTPGSVFDQIRSIYIDNSFSDIPIYVKFPDTQFIIICPANSVLMAPVFCNSNKKFLVYAQDFDDTNIPVTTIHVSNVEVAGFVVGTGQNTPDPVKSIVNTYGAKDAAFTNVHTFTGVSIGTAGASRCVYVAIWADTDIGLITVTGVTIGGIAATQINQVSKVTNTGTNWGCVALYARVVAAGDTATVAVTTSGNSIAAIAVAAAYNLVTPLVPATQITGSDSNNPVTVPLSTPFDGVAVVSAGSWSSVSLTGIAQTQSDALRGLVGSQKTNGTALSLTVTGGAGTKVNLIAAASFN